MRKLQSDLSVFGNFNFDKVPVGVKYLHKKPDGIEKLDKKLNFCEMPKEAQNRGTPFYVEKDNESCSAGSFPMGWKEVPPGAEYGQIGVELGVFQEARTNAQLFLHAPMFSKGVINYVVFSPLDKLTFEPDLLLVLASVDQAQIIMRAMTYSTFELYESKTSGVLACSWIFVYPFQSGKVNYITTGLSYGMKVKEVYPPGYILLCIPYQKLPQIIQGLREMKWHLPEFEMGRDGFMEYFSTVLNQLEE